MVACKVFVVLSILTVTTALPDTRIIGGADASAGQFPYQASLRDANNVHFCGGAILNTRWIGTVAHCVAGRLIGNTRTVVGSHLLNTGGLNLATAQIVIHPNYNGNTVENDVALINTQTAIMYNDFIQPIVMGTAFVGAGASATMSGWGMTTFPSAVSNQLQFLAKLTLTNAECRAQHTPANAERVYDNTICTYSTGTGFCLGDHGGPVTSGNTLIGLMSFNIPCATGAPDIHIRISSHRAWILTVI